jgi:hypothetical protein
MSPEQYQPRVSLTLQSSSLISPSFWGVLPFVASPGEIIQCMTRPDTPGEFSHPLKININYENQTNQNTRDKMVLITSIINHDDTIITMEWKEWDGVWH